MEIKEIDANFSTVGSKLMWIYFYDNDIDKKEANGVAGKHTYIMIRNTKQNRDIIEHYWGNSLVDN